MRYEGPGFYGLNPPLWVSGAAQQPSGQWVTSPADKEVYQRTAATNSSTTDPADDTTNYVARSYERTAAIVGAFLDANAGGSGFSALFIGATKSSLPAIGVGARTSILSVTGRGAVDYLAFLKVATGTTRVEVFVDGRSVLDQTDTYSASTALVAVGEIDIGTGTTRLSAARLVSPGVEFRRSLEVWITNTATASTTNAGIAYNLRSVA